MNCFFLRLPYSGRRLGWLTVMIMLSALMLAACGDVTPTSPAQTLTGPTAAATTRAPSATVGLGDPANPVTITWSFWGDASEVEVNNRVKKQFEATYPGIKVNNLHDSWNKYFDLLKTQWIGDKTPDVMFLDNIPTWASQGYLESIDNFIQREKFDISDFYPGLVDMFRYNKTLYGLPRDNDTKVIYVNLDMLKEAGLDLPKGGWTWQDLRQMALKLTQRDSAGNITRYGFAFEPDTWWKLWVWQNDAEVYDKFSPPQPPTRLLLDNPSAIEAVQFFADLINVDKVTPTYDQMNSGDSIAELFKTRKLAMAFGNHTNVAVYGKTAGLKWDVVPLAAGKKRANVLGGAGYVIHQNSKRKEEAWTFLKWLTGPVGQALFADTGIMVPARKSVREDNIFLRQQPYNTQVFLQETELGHQYPEYINSGEVDSLINTELKQVWQGKAKAADVMSKLPAKVEPILARSRST